MIFIANKTREIEKINNNIEFDILKIKEDIKINEIELITHKNSSYINKLHRLYFSDFKKSDTPKIISFHQLLKKNQNVELVNTDN